MLKMDTTVPNTNISIRLLAGGRRTEQISRRSLSLEAGGGSGDERSPRSGVGRHRQQGAGVCATCLRERLSHLSVSTPVPSVVVRGCGEDVEGHGGRRHQEAALSSCSESEASTAYSSEGCSVAAFLLARREQRRAAAAATSFWAKLLRATRGGGKKDDRGCSLAARSNTRAGRRSISRGRERVTAGYRGIEGEEEVTVVGKVVPL
jgi:hypothetical protein